MKCKKCGNELSENAKFCGKCGTPVSESPYETQKLTEQSQPEQQKSEQSETVQPKSEASGKQEDREKKAPWSEMLNNNPEAKDKLNGFAEKTKGNKKLIGIAAAAVVVLVVIIAVFMNARKTINLNDYVTVEFGGYDTVGTASVTIDEDALGQKIQEVGKVPELSDEMAIWEGLSPSDVFEIIMAYFGSDFIDADVTPADGLSNGDKVTVNISYSEQIGKELGVKFKAKEETIEVKGLEEAEAIDPFADVTVEYEGFAPALRVNISNNSSNEYLSGLTYTTDIADGLRPGDTFTVTVDADEESAFSHGYILTETSKEYTCEGCNFYVEDIADIQDGTLNKLKKDAEDIVDAAYADAVDSLSNNGLNFVGYCVYSPKTLNSVTWYGNGIWLIYKTTVSHVEGKFEPTEIYLTVRFKNLIEYADGSQVYDEGEFLRGSSNIEYGFFSSVKGDTDSDRMYSDLVTRNQDEYKFSMDEGFEKLGEK